jgi:hypothetical protein
VEPFVADVQMEYDYGIDYTAAWMLKACLSNGFTTLRDVGGGLRRHRQAVNDWLIPGPRLFIGGPVLSQTGGHGTSTLPIIPRLLMLRRSWGS